MISLLMLVAEKNKITLTIALSIIFTLSVLNPAVAKPEGVKIVAPISGEKLLTEKLTGFWADMQREITNDIKPPVTFTALPFKRALTDFSSKEFDCIWSLDKSLLSRVGLEISELIESDLVFEATQHVFMSPTLPKILSLDALAGKRVGIGGGSSHEKKLQSISAKVVLLSDQRSKLRLLENQRIDAFIGWLPDLLIMNNGKLSGDVLLKNSLWLSKSGVRFVCQDTINNAEFLKQLNTNIERYKNSEQFRNLFTSYGASMMLENETY